MHSYLFLGTIWLLGAIYFFAWPIYHPAAQRYTILDSDWSIGWLFLLAMLWNLARWWMTRARARASSGAPLDPAGKPE